MPWNDRHRLYAVAQAVRGVGWLLAALILVVGTVMAATDDGELALLFRAMLAGAILAACSAAAWLITRYANRAASR
jgi:hypothetical protein